MKKETFTVTVNGHDEEFVTASKASSYIAELQAKEDRQDIRISSSLREVYMEEDFDQTPKSEYNYDQTRGTSP